MTTRIAKHNFSRRLVIRRRQARRAGEERPRRRWRRIGYGLGAGLGIFLSASLVAFGMLYASVTSDLPSMEQLPLLLDRENGLLLQPTRLYDRNGQTLLVSLENPGQERRFLTVNPTQAEHYDPRLVQMTITLFDPDFWVSPGFAWRRLVSPLPQTLAERLASDLLLSGEPPGLRRSLRMRLLAAQVTAHYGRVQVMEWFLNSTGYGSRVYGADNATRLYLGKPASSLSLAEAAFLSALSQTPALNPFDSPQSARDRTRQVLQQLATVGAISAEDYAQAAAEELAFRPAPPTPDEFSPAFTRRALEEAYGLLGRERVERGGLRIITSLDTPLQRQAACAIRVQIQRLTGQPEKLHLPDGSSCETGSLLPTLPPGGPDYPLTLAGTLVVLDVQSGQVLALTGDLSLQGEKPVLSPRPPGSLLTPFVALAAFSRSFSPASLVWDMPASLPAGLAGTPNPDGSFHGPQRLRTALANDYLAPLTHLLDQLTPQTVWRLTELLGVDGLMEGKDPGALLYGGGGSDPLKMAQAYAVFASGGLRIGEAAAGGEPAPAFLLSVTDASGRSLLSREEPQRSQVVSPQLAFLVHDMLADGVARRPSLGYPNPLEIGRPSGSKVGQTLEGYDVWTAGYTPSVSVVARLFLPQTGEETPQLETRQAAGIWYAVMQYLGRTRPAEGWEVPSGVQTVSVCDPSGMLPTPSCPLTVKEVFLSGNEPTQADTLYQVFQVNRETGRLATVFTPLELVETRTCMVVPPEALNWARQTGVPLPPAEYDSIRPPRPSVDANISAPVLFAYVHGKVNILGTAAGENFASYRLQVGQGINPQSWVQVGTDSTTPVHRGILGSWDTTGQEGLYALRLTVLRQDQTIETAAIQLTVDNTPPTVRVSYPRSGQQFSLAIEREIILQAEVADAIGLQRVAWYVDGKPAGETSLAPYSLLWEPEAGEHRLKAVAHDLAGNESESEEIRISVGR